MPETIETTTEKEAPVVKAGAPQPVSPKDLNFDFSAIGMSDSDGEQEEEAEETEVPEIKQTEKAPEKTAGGEVGKDATPEEKPAELKLTEEQIKAYLKEQGIEFEGGISALKEKLTSEPAKELTPEQKAEQERVRDTQILNKFIEKGGTPEIYVGLKQTMAADPQVLGEGVLRTQLKQGKYSEDEIGTILHDQFFQLTDDEIADFEDEAERDFATRRRDFGRKQLESFATPLIQQAKSAYQELQDEISVTDLEHQLDEQFSAKAVETVKQLPRKFTFQLGKTEDGKDIAPIEYDVDATHLSELQETLANPAKRKQFFYNEDNSMNLQNVANVMLRNLVLESALKTTYHESAKRQVELFEAVFPKTSAADVGLGGGRVERPKQPSERPKMKQAGQPQQVTFQRS